MVPLLALFAVVLIGCTAIATDLSVATHYKRNLQNTADAAALAGAKQLPAPASLTSSSQAAAAEAAVEVIHNAFPFDTAGDPNWAKNLVVTHAGCGGATKACSVTACIQLSDPACTASWQNYSAAGVPPFSFTVNTPPKTAAVAAFNTCCANSYYQRVEVVMHQRSGAFFAGLFGVGSNIAGAQAVAFHLAGSQGFPFALFSNTVIGDGNSNEIISGNVYAARYLNPQSSGQAAVCASNDANGKPGYIVLGAPQQGDSGYAKDGQYDNTSITKTAWTIQDSVADCTTLGSGYVGMTGNPSDCSSAFAGSMANANIGTDGNGDACEANPALQDPNVEAPPNIPTYATTQCESIVTSPTVVNPTLGAFQCSGAVYKNQTPSLTIDSAHVSSLTPGIYEVLPSNNAPCDVTIDGTYTDLTGVTFYLEKGAGICMSPPVGTTITQSPYCGSCSSGSATQGDGIYDVLSDNVGTPTITMSTGGSSSGAGVWEVFGTIWLPTGTVNVGNKDAIQDDGQILVNVWNDQSGYHPTDSVTYNGSYSPSQKEILQLVE